MGPAGQGCRELCSDNTRAGADSPGGLTWGPGPWQGRGSPGYGRGSELLYALESGQGVMG